jgi:hypothetical protein
MENVDATRICWNHGEFGQLANSSKFLKIPSQETNPLATIPGLALALRTG